MAALDPNRELDSFAERAAALHHQYERLYDAVELEDDRLDLRKRLAVDAAFRLGVEWERLQHRWHIAAISRDPAKVLAAYRVKIDEKSRALPRELVEVFHASISHREVTRLRASEIEVLIDPQDRNQSFSDTSAWLSAASRDLSSIHIERVSRLATDPQNSSLLDLLKGIRNYVAHGSKDASARLNRLVSFRDEGSEVGLIGKLNAPLLRPTPGVRDLGSYLNADLGYPATTRFSFLHVRVMDATEVLRLRT